MVRYESDDDCYPEGNGMMYLTRHKVYYCDRCGDELCSDRYRVDDEDLCEYCLKDMFECYDD